MVEGDILNDDGARVIVDQASRKFGSLDVLINNAGDYPMGTTFEDTTADDLRKAFRSNVVAAMCVTKAATAKMKELGIAGHVLNASRDNAFVTEKDAFLPSTTAWAMRGTTRAMAKQVAKADIKVNAYCVGGEATDEEVANVVAYLAGPLNNDITGQNVMINRGRYMD